MRYNIAIKVTEDGMIGRTVHTKETMKNITLGKTGITAPQNGFGALPIQRDSKETAVKILRKAYEGGIRFFDTARAYTDSEEKIGIALSPVRDRIVLATKTKGVSVSNFRKELQESLTLLQTDYIDIYQFHCADRVYRPGDGSGLYECMTEAKEVGKIRHIGITTHKIGVAEEAVKSGLYETLQYPFSYLSGEQERRLVALCRERNVGFIAMKGLAGGLITNAKAAMAYIGQFDNVMPIWGVQREPELDDWLAFMRDTPSLDDDMEEFIAKERKELSGEFCRGCGYCMPCPQGIMINQCARMSLMLRRAPSKAWLSEQMQAEMKKIETCLRCGQCQKKCPYSLNTPELLRANYEDYKRILAGEISVD